MPYKSHLPSIPLPKKPVGNIFPLWKHSVEDPNRPAFINAEDSTDNVTFRDLYTRSLSTATFLEELHFGHGDVACIDMRNCWEYFAIFLGVALRGGAMSGANHLFTEYELQRQFKDSASKIVFCDEESLQKCLKAAKGCPNIQTIVVVHKRSPNLDLPFGLVSFKNVLKRKPNVNSQPIDIDTKRDVLLLPYSSGTTGSPKGVMISHRNVGAMIDLRINHTENYIMKKIDPQFDWKQQHVMLFLPFAHVFGLQMLLRAVICRATGVLISKFQPKLLCQCIEKYKVRLLKIPPPVVIFLSKSEIPREFDLSSVEVIIMGGAPLGKELCDDVMAKMPNLKLLGQSYGMTELTVISHQPVYSGKQQKFGTAGKLLSNNEMKIVDPKTKEEKPSGERGEICIRGPTVMMGYLNRPQATAQTIDDEGWLHTGDVGYVDSDGDLFVVDRLKELIKVKTFQVPPAELEDLLLSHPKIHDAAVIGIPNVRDGEHPMAVVKKDADLSEEDVKSFVKDRVAPYKQLAGGVQFIHTIPKSSSGKIMRRYLRDEALAIRNASQSKI
ncbi:hypothetical protein L596_013048 [Steinernema carpocapsae]|uniref:AMP-dependent synthetase/ligase domain-containing protein n=1 Tax=Steinernema carpocapsae TaxID=34508 RepID=A0A4U5NZU4_STECR|nr:hypothetical protein L596_013048 [Steinernema carpocapsae]